MVSTERPTHGAFIHTGGSPKPFNMQFRKPNNPDHSELADDEHSDEGSSLASLPSVDSDNRFASAAHAAIPIPTSFAQTSAIARPFDVDTLEGVWVDLWSTLVADNDLFTIEPKSLEHDSIRDETMELLRNMLDHLPGDLPQPLKWKLGAERSFYRRGDGTGRPGLVDVAVATAGQPGVPRHPGQITLVVEVKPCRRGIRQESREADKQIRARVARVADKGEMDRLILISLIGPYMRIYHWQKTRNTGDDALGTIRPTNKPAEPLPWRYLPAAPPESDWLPLSSDNTRRILQQVVIDCKRSAIGLGPEYPDMYGEPGDGPCQLPETTNVDSPDPGNSGSSDIVMS